MVAWLSSWRWLSGLVLSLPPTSGILRLNDCLLAHLRLEENYNVTACLPSPWGSYDPSKIGSPPSQASWHELVDVYDVDGTTNIGNATAWEAQTSCLWHRTVYVILRLPDERFLLQQRAAWKWRMGGLWDLGLSETVELDEDLWTAANRAVTEELGEHAPRHHLRECCRLSVGWSGSMPQMQVEVLPVSEKLCTSGLSGKYMKVHESTYCLSQGSFALDPLGSLWLFNITSVETVILV
eukprot:s363_g11.t1